MRYAIVEISKTASAGLPHMIIKKIDMATTTIEQFNTMVDHYNADGYEVNVIRYE